MKLTKSRMRPGRAQRQILAVAIGIGAGWTLFQVRGAPPVKVALDGYGFRPASVRLDATLPPEHTSSNLQNPSPIPPQSEGAPGAPLLVKIRADAMQTRPETPDALRALRTEIAAVVKEATADSEATEDWALWAHLEGQPVDIYAAPSNDLSADALGLYATRTDQGATLCLRNRSRQRLDVATQLRLPRGIYKIERLVFSLPAERMAHNTPRLIPTAALEKVAPAIPDLPVYLSRLEGWDLANTGVIPKKLRLEPGQVCLVRYTEQGMAVRQAHAELLQRLHELTLSTPAPARQLRRILDEGDPYWSGLYATSAHASKDRRLGCIHRLLLVVAQAHSVHHNFQGHKRVHEEPGAAVMGALERLTDALAETSAVLMGMVPQIIVVPDARPTEGPTAPDATPRFYTVTIALGNTGTQEAHTVKIGLNSPALPSGVTCEPSDPAFFGTLYPGQTARVTFRLHCSAQSAFVASQCVGDLSYFAKGAPAHLCARPW